MCKRSRPALIYFMFFFYFREIFERQAESTDEVLRDLATESGRDLLLAEPSEYFEYERLEFWLRLRGNFSPFCFSVWSGAYIPDVEFFFLLRRLVAS